MIVTDSIDRRGQATYRRVTFAELEALSNRYANGLKSVGIDRGTRTLVMVRPGVDFVGVIFALFKIGAVPVMIDPGMGVGRLLDCVRQVDVEAFVGIPLAQAMRVLRPGAFRSVRTVVTVGRRWFWDGTTLASLAKRASDRFDMTPTRPGDTAAILFTSGSTGPAKGVVYEHGMFDAQVRLIRDFYGIEPGEVDLPAFPLFVLFSTAMGMTAVIPDMNPSHPAKVDPADIVRAIRDHNVTNTFGSPAIWKRVADYCTKNNIKLPSIRRILIAGAPVPWPVIAELHNALPDTADVHTPYGATESLPIASISGQELIAPASREPQLARTNGDSAECEIGNAGLAETLTDRTRRGAGTCVGRVFPDTELRFIRIIDDPIANWSDDLTVPEGEIGEIIVAGPVVTKEYFGLPYANELAKIRDGDRVWHRMGDVGYRDPDGRIWFCGRKAHRVRTAKNVLFTECVEPIFNQHPEVFRTALVGVHHPPNQTPVMVIELKSGRLPSQSDGKRICDELRALGQAVVHTADITHFLFHKGFPVDVRHNAKINREQLAHWAAERIR